MKRVRPVFAIVILLAGTFMISGCSGTPEPSQSNTSQANTNKTQSNANAAATSGAPMTTATGTITATPNPSKVCDDSKAGVTKLTWNAEGTAEVEVRVNRPDGDLFAKSGPSGTGTTAKWVGNGMRFYLQDVSGGKPLTAENTIRVLTVTVNNEGCP
jgi:hypothetical protein